MHSRKNAARDGDVTWSMTLYDPAGIQYNPTYDVRVSLIYSPHSKVKYKEFQDFNDLVAPTRVYVLRLEALETDRDKNDFIRKIDGSYDSKHAVLIEIIEIIIDKKEIVVNAVANIYLENRQVEESKN
ncbi:hypothetical protein OUZ56_010430 [Daphnia magna]|uniref:MATH domain-containing protein n=1 Tax=Daphnia magna TaxID=35525 RepID=A0ABR0AIN2_9CRUS|nr:hypothetical protein OUZ56_010430 [Daphnia magna]